MGLTLIPAVDLQISEMAGLMNRAFEGYIGGVIRFNKTSFLQFVHENNIDLNLSWGVAQGITIVGLGLIARQGWTNRLAAMGIVPEQIGQGVGTWFLGQLIEEAARRGDERYVLEVIEQNVPGVRLYKRHGFRVVGRLFGYTAQKPQARATPDLAEVDMFDVAGVCMKYGPPDLPWQIAGPTIARFGPAYRGYRLGPAYAAIAVSKNLVTLRALVVPPEFQSQGHATRLLQALSAHYPRRSWKVSAICPEPEGSNLFEKLGFMKDEINQFQMELKLDLKRA